MVLKGHWKLSNDEGSQEDFIYKKMGQPESEDLLEEYFCDRSFQRIPIKSQSFSNSSKLESFMYLDFSDTSSIE